jgi:histidine triad (HIT) family protein
MAECVFCAIVAGEEPASVVFEDSATMAFLDIRQFHPGHVLVIPKEHVADVRGLSDELGAAVMRSVGRASRAVTAAIAPDGINVWHAAGAAAGQDVFHAHFHVYPRYAGDGMLAVYPPSPAQPPREELDRIAAEIRGRLDE